MTMEDIVPKDSLYRKIDKYIDLTFIYEKIKVDAEYRWFLGIPFSQETPHFSTFSKNYERRFKDTDIFEEIFVEIVNQAIKYNLVDGQHFILIQHIRKQMRIKINIKMK